MTETTITMRHSNGRSITWTVRITRISRPYASLERFALELQAGERRFQAPIQQVWYERRLELAPEAAPLPSAVREAMQAVCVLGWIAGSFSLPLEDQLCPDLDVGPASAGMN